MKYMLIMNPTAKSGTGKNKWDRIFELLRSRNAEFDYRISEYPGHAVELAKNATLEGHEVVVAVGGDGTINDVLCGIMEGGGSSSMGIIYTGTSPDICRFHGIPVDPDGAVGCLLRDNRREIDVGEVCYRQENGSDSQSKISYFLCSVNLGIGARVADGSNTGLRKYFGDLAGTFFSVVKSVLTYTAADLKYRADGEEKISQKTVNLTLGKNPYIASGLKVMSDIAPDDGRMYLFSINNFSFISLLWNIRKLYRGDFQNHPKNTFMLVSEFECDYNRDAPEVEFDGDPHGYLPCRVRLIKKGLKLVK